MTQREALNDDQKKLNWLLGLEKETLADMAHQQSKIIEKLQKADKAQAVPCQNVNEAINNPMPRGYMLNTLVKFQKWRIGEDVRTLDETGLTPRLITLAIDWAIEQLDKSKSQAVPEWIQVSERLPMDGENVLIFDKYCTHGSIYTLMYYDGFMLKHKGVTHWMPLPAAPEQQK